VVSDPLYRDALLRSLRVAGLATTVCLLMGFPMALAIARATPRWQTPLLLAVMLAVLDGFLMRINAWIVLLADDGWLARILGGSRLLYTDTAMYIGVVLYLPPVHGAAAVRAAVRLDPVLMEAAADLGAPPRHVFLRIILRCRCPAWRLA